MNASFLDSFILYHGSKFEYSNGKRKERTVKMPKIKLCELN